MILLYSVSLRPSSFHCFNSSLFVWIYVTNSDRPADRCGKTKIQTLPINICSECVFVCMCAGYFCFCFFSKQIYDLEIFRCDHVHDDFKWKISSFLLNSSVEWFLFHCKCLGLAWLGLTLLLVISLAFSIALSTTFVCHFGATLITVLSVCACVNGFHLI